MLALSRHIGEKLIRSLSDAVDPSTQVGSLFAEFKLSWQTDGSN